MSGQSYAIPTKSTPYVSLPLEKIQVYVQQFREFAESHPALTFHVTKIGCLRAGYTPSDIAPMFKNSPSNVILPESFKKILDATV